MRSKIYSIATAGILGLSLASVAGNVSAQVWSNPSAAPTGGNTATPLNVSNVTQTKSGVLNVSGLRSYVDLIADGNVGIGTTAPVGKLSVAGSQGVSTIIQLTNNHDWVASRIIGKHGSHYAGFVWGTEATSPVAYGYGFDYSGNPLLGNLSGGATALFVNRSNSNVGIGNTSPAYKLDITGSVGATAFYYTSDENLKKNIEPLRGSLSKVLDLQGVSFAWKESGDKSIGLVAQDVEKVYPELVHTTEAGVKSVEYGNLVAPLVEAIKEQQKQIDDLKKEISDLKAAK